MLVIVLALLTNACAGNQARFGPPVNCDAKPQGRLLLFAQAVPEAQQIPCLSALPPGWKLAAVDARTGEAEFTITNAGLDVDAEVRLSPSCAGDAAAATPGVTLSSDAETLFAFEGGCVTVRFVGDSRAEDRDELLDSIQFISRDELRALSGWEL